MPRAFAWVTGAVLLAAAPAAARQTQTIPTPRTCVAAGAGFFVAVMSDGAVWTWGSNERYQAGLPGNPRGTSYLSPVRVPIEGRAIAVAAGTDYALALLDDGRLWSWGNSLGGLGKREREPGPVPYMTDVVAVEAKGETTLALRRDGTIWHWGFGAGGLAGDGSMTREGQTAATVRAPARVHGPGDVVAISLSGAHALALRSDGTVWAWGANASGQVGNGARSPVPVPVQVPGLRDVTAIAAGFRVSYAVVKSGTVMGWGSNALGRLGTPNLPGDSSSHRSLLPRQVPTLRDVGWIWAVAPRDFAAYALGRDGRLYSWGEERYGLLGRPPGTTVTLPDGWAYTREPGPVDRAGDIGSVSTHGNTVIGLRHDGTVVVWGYNTNPHASGIHQPAIWPTPVAGLPRNFAAECHVPR